MSVPVYTRDDDRARGRGKGQNKTDGTKGNDEEEKGIRETSGYAMVVHGRPKTPKNASFWGLPSPQGSQAPIF